MKKALTILTLIALFTILARASFTNAKIVELKQVRDSAGIVTGIYFVLEIRDDSTTEWTECKYLVAGDEFASLPTGATAKKAALLAIAKREAHLCHAKWIVDLATRAQPPATRDPTTDLGAASFSSFTGEASPLPTPTPTPTP